MVACDRTIDVVALPGPHHLPALPRREHTWDGLCGRQFRRSWRLRRIGRSCSTTWDSATRKLGWPWRRPALCGDGSKARVLPGLHAMAAIECGRKCWAAALTAKLRKTAAVNVDFILPLPDVSCLLRRQQPEVVVDGVVRHIDRGAIRAGASRMLRICGDQRLLHAKHRIGIDVRLPAANRCVVIAAWPGAETIMWMCPGRMGWRPMLFSMRPTGPSVGTGSTRA